MMVHPLHRSSTGRLARRANTTIVADQETSALTRLRDFLIERSGPATIEISSLQSQESRIDLQSRVSRTLHTSLTRAVSLQSAEPSTRHAEGSANAIPDAISRNEIHNTCSRSQPPILDVPQTVGRLLQTANDNHAMRKKRVIEVGSGTSTPHTMESGKLSVPSVAAKVEEKRKLRSQNGGSRLKSELSVYFPNYDDIINDTPKQPGKSMVRVELVDFIVTNWAMYPDYLDTNDIIYIVNEPTKTPTTSQATAQTKSSPKSASTGLLLSTPSSQQATTSTAGLWSANPGFQRIDLNTVSLAANNDPEDALPDSLYFKPHRRAERKEKQLRNIEKERAMHEKTHLERLLDNLQGPDWLKAMGITGITDTEKKDFEPKRDYFVKEVLALVDKFRIWKEEERRLRLEREERERPSLAPARAGTEGDFDSQVGEFHDNASTVDQPPASDDDAWAARQLLQEANSASRQHPSAMGVSGRPRGQAARGGSRAHQSLRGGHNPSNRSISNRPSLQVEIDLNTPFTSFFKKPYERAAAVGDNRHGRGAMAFGHPLPQVEEQNFEPPSDYLTPECLREHGRKRRRLQRGSPSGKRKV